MAIVASAFNTYHPNMLEPTKNIPTGAEYVTLNIKNEILENSTYPHAAQENGFSPAFLLSLLRLVKSAAKLCTC
jgi:hypothetical protein